MQARQRVTFGPYQLMPQTWQLQRGTQEVKLTPKAAAVLHDLLDHAEQVVTKEELFAAVWPETVASDAALSSRIQELRQVLRDDARNPRYIETVHRRGYRFIGKVVSQEEDENQKSKGKNGGGRERGRTEEALEAAAQALQLKPSFADGHLGVVGIAGHYEEARGLLQRYLGRYPNLLPYHLFLAIYSELGQAAEA